MNLIPRNSVFDFDSLFNDLFRGFGKPALSANQTGSIAGMRVDISEEEDHFLIHAELPGVKKKDITLTLQDEVLTISAMKHTETEKKEAGKIIWQERSTGSITRSFTVGPGLTEKDIKAHFDDGVLTLNVPKRENGQIESARRIPIN